MPVQFDGIALCEAEGRSVIHFESDDVAHDVAALTYLLTHWSAVEYEIIAEEHSIHLLEKLPHQPR